MLHGPSTSDPLRALVPLPDGIDPRVVGPAVLGLGDLLPGEGRTAAAQPPVSPWGVQTKGFKTRRNKRTQVMIVRDRRVK